MLRDSMHRAHPIDSAGAGPFAEVQKDTDFTLIRYAQCWEDADILLEGLDVQPGDVCLSVASAGDNTLSLLTRNPARVVALDLSPAQLACLELRVAAYKELSHAELLELVGACASSCRLDLYGRVRALLPATSRAFWDAKPESVAMGVGACGKFEKYFRLFREVALPLIHDRKTVESLYVPRTRDERHDFYDRVWDSWRWRLTFRLFFSRRVMGRLGRDPRFFKYVDGDVSRKILAHARDAITELDPRENPYLQWITGGSYPFALPHALRPENFELIRGNLDRLELHEASVESYLDGESEHVFDRFNMSDIFEYMSPESYEACLVKLARAARPGGRVAYWNMLAPRTRPESLAHVLRPLAELAARLHRRDKAFFYSAFVVEQFV